METPGASLQRLRGRTGVPWLLPTVIGPWPTLSWPAAFLGGPFFLSVGLGVFWNFSIPRPPGEGDRASSGQRMALFPSSSGLLLALLSLGPPPIALLASPPWVCSCLPCHTASQGQ